MTLYGILGAFLLGLALAWWDGHTRLREFQEAVSAVGHAQEERTKLRIERDKEKKEAADREHKTLAADLAATRKRLRDARASRSIVPAAPANAVRPELSCYDRSELERTLRGFTEGVEALVGEGDEAAIALGVARRWAKSLPQSNP